MLASRCCALVVLKWTGEYGRARYLKFPRANKIDNEKGKGIRMPTYLFYDTGEESNCAPGSTIQDTVSADGMLGD